VLVASFITPSADTLSVTQGDTNVVFSAKIENIGEGNASNITFFLAMPSDWVVTFGSTNVSFSELLSGDSEENIIEVSIPSNASTGSKNVLVNASGLNATGTDLSTLGLIFGDDVTVTVNTPSQSIISGGGGGGGAAGDTGTGGTDTGTSTGGGGGGGGGGSLARFIETVLSGEEILHSSETIELFRGQSDSFPISVKNIFEDTAFTQVSLKVEGFLSQYIDIFPIIIDIVQFGETREFTVTITSPEYLEEGTHELTMIITGKIIGQNINKNLIEKRKVTLIIHSVSEEEAMQSLELALSAIQAMMDAQFPTTQISKRLEEAKQALEERDFEKVKELADKIQMMRENALAAYALIEEVQNKMKTYHSLTSNKMTGSFLGVPQSFSETQEIIHLALAAFEREDYETALQRAKDAQLTLALEGGEFNLIFFLIDYWWAILLSLIFLSITGFFSYKTYAKATISQKIRNLGKEEETIRELMKESQKKHYKGKTMGEESFKTAMAQYQKRFSKIKQLKTKLRHKRVRLLKPKKIIKDLEEERNEVIKHLHTLQKDYFAKGKISKAAYDEQLQIYHERLAEIENEQLTLETRLSKKVKKK